MRSEAEVISYLRRRFPAGGGLRVGIGDDAAVLAGEGRRDWVVTTDLMVEGDHFLPGIPAHAVGWKALARSLSDIAAMGARPRYALVALAVPRATPSRWVRAFFAGMRALARPQGVKLAGGDLSSAPQIVADVQVLGEVSSKRAVLRRGARAGELIFVSGTLGLSQLGLIALRHRRVRLTPLLKRALRAHRCPAPRLALAQALVRRARVSAMIDVSDGLSTDVAHLCQASRVGARIFAGRIPAVELPVDLVRRFRTNALELALNGGEDYELLFTLPGVQAKRMPKQLAGVKLTPIGEITRGRRVTLVDSRGRERELKPRGWDPFRRR
ncbi:MAG: thiamine-phosphate kinase [Terriglobia bacterium]